MVFEIFPFQDTPISGSDMVTGQALVIEVLPFGGSFLGALEGNRGDETWRFLEACVFGILEDVHASQAIVPAVTDPSDSIHKGSIDRAG